MYAPTLTKGLSNQEPSPVGAETKKKGCYPFFDVFSTAGTWFLTTEWEAKNRSANAFRGSRRLTDEVYFLHSPLGRTVEDVGPYDLCEFLILFIHKFIPSFCAVKGRSFVCPKEVPLG